jgi:hypothetical protein
MESETLRRKEKKRLGNLPSSQLDLKKVIKFEERPLSEHNFVIEMSYLNQQFAPSDGESISSPPTSPFAVQVNDPQRPLSPSF